MNITEKVKNFDTDGKFKKEIAKSLTLLLQFRKEYPVNDPDFVANMTADDLYKKGGDYFFKWIQYTLSGIGRIGIGSDRSFLKACERVADFKELLQIAADPTKSLAEKIDAPWDRISGMGGDRVIPKKIITSYDDKVIPIFKTEDMEYFHSQLVGPFSSSYDSLTLGQKYELLTQALIKEKQSHTETKEWGNAYLMRFLYEMYPPPRDKISWVKPIIPQPLSGVGLLFSPQTHEEMVFLFAKMHDKIGFPYITRVQTAYPDVFVLDQDRKIKGVEIEVIASQFDHDPKKCDVIVCWENDLDTVPEDWPEIIQLKDYM